MRIEQRGAMWGLGAALVCALVLMGCPGTLDDRDRFLDAGGCPDVPKEIFAKSCDGAGCHGTDNPAMGLDLVSPGLVSRVLDQPAKGCAGSLADPMNASGSMIYGKLFEPAPCGARMPLSHMPLSDEEIACVKDWIESLGM